MIRSIRRKENIEMPEISRFFGIIIRMYFEDHNPPHFHAEYGDEKAEFAISDLQILDGRINKRAKSMIIEWAFIHRQELFRNWKRLQNGNMPRRIKPLK
jgi:hypothetical protein